MNTEKPENSYIINVGQAAEAVRLYDQDRFFTEAMGGLLPEPGVHPDAITELLDIGCGAAWWTSEIAFRYPGMQVNGIDIDQKTIEYARVGARAQGLDNVSFVVMNAKQPLDFETDRFGLVNVRLAVGFMDCSTWPALINECLRILCPGGILRLTEIETTVTTSRSLHLLNEALNSALLQDGRTFGINGASLGITPMQGYLMEQVGFAHVQKRPFIVDASYDKPLYDQSIKNAEVFYLLAKPWLCNQGALNKTLFETLHQNMLIEIRQPNFLCLSYGLTTWGYKEPDSAGALRQRNLGGVYP